MIPDIVKHGENGMISNDEKELRSYIEQLLEDEDLRNKLGENARQTVIKQFSEESFISNWSRIFDEAYNIKNNNFYKKA